MSKPNVRERLREAERQLARKRMREYLGMEMAIQLIQHAEMEKTRRKGAE